MEKIISLKARYGLRRIDLIMCLLRTGMNLTEAERAAAENGHAVLGSG